MVIIYYYFEAYHFIMLMGTTLEFGTNASLLDLGLDVRVAQPTKLFAIRVLLVCGAALRTRSGGRASAGDTAGDFRELFVFA